MGSSIVAPYQDRAWLEHHYHVEGLSLHEIAKMTGCCHRTILRWMRKFDIPRRDRKTASRLGCNKYTGRKLLVELYQDLEWLKEKYLMEGLSPRGIARQANCSRSAIEYWLKIHKIPRRNKSDGLKQAWKRGDLGNDSWKAAQSKAQVTAWDDEEKRERHAKRMREQHAAGIYKDVYTEEVREKMSAGLRAAHRRGCYDDCVTEETRRKLSLAHTGSKHWNWRGGKSFEPYPVSFNKEFKRKIMERDNYTCAICRLVAEVVHHINYIKDNTIPENCIALCRGCHGKTNVSRDYWQVALTELLEKRNGVTKVQRTVTGARVFGIT